MRHATHEALLNQAMFLWWRDLCPHWKSAHFLDFQLVLFLVYLGRFLEPRQRFDNSL